jgi:hypothetical protein
MDPNGHEIDPPLCPLCNITWLNYSNVSGIANTAIDGLAWIGCLFAGCHANAAQDTVAGPTQGEWMYSGVVGLVSPLDMPSSGFTIPRGFKTAADFQKFSDTLKSGLSDAGYTDVTAAFQGSSVTGVQHGTGAPFDVGRTSDFDIALAGQSLLAKAKELGISLRSGGTRTGPLTPENLADLGLSDLAAQLSQEAGRPVNFMIFDTMETAMKKAPSIKLRWIDQE